MRSIAWSSIGENEEHFIKELAWRDFSYYQMYYYPDLPTKNINSKFDNFEWENDTDLLKAWQIWQDRYPNRRCWNA